MIQDPSIRQWTSLGSVKGKMDPNRAITRRMAIKDLGKAGLAIMVFGTACTNESTVTTLTGGTLTTGLASSSTGASTASTTAPILRAESAWARVNMGFVSAYILYRDGEAALIDTGQSGAGRDIEAALGFIGLGWEAIGNVIVTHRHPDHAGSLLEVATAAPNAAIYAGAGDLDAIGDLPSGPPMAVGDGDTIFDLAVIETPGHTPGHICVLDPNAGILVAGDALNTSDGSLKSSDPRFTADQVAADTSIAKLAGFEYEVILPGHGEPILGRGSAEVTALADELSG